MDIINFVMVEKMETSINELIDKIDNLNKQIENEPKNSKKRKYEIESKIEKIKMEKNHAGFRNDFSLVKKYKSQIEQLEKEKKLGFVLKFKSEIKNCQNQIVDIILDYYKNGIYIDDIIKLEDIHSNTSERWLNLSNFGKNTGYLFIDNIEEEEYNWIYSNPITEIQFKSKTLEELIIDIKTKNEILFIFDNQLADNSNNKDLTLYHKAIDSKLTDLENYEISNANDDFDYLKMYAEKFDGYQIRRFCQIMIDNPKLNYSTDFNYILDINKDKFDKIFLEDIYCKIIDSKLKILSRSYHEDEIISDLREYSEKFNKNQLITLCNYLVDKEDISFYFDDLNYILNVNANQIDCNEFYKNFIDRHIEKLNDDDMSYWDKSRLLKDLNLYADKFSKKQILQLFDLIFDNYNVSNHYIKNILELNRENIDSEYYNKFYEKIINECFNELNTDDVDSDDVEIIFEDLRVCANYFNQNQIFKLCDLIFEKEYILTNFEDFNYILDVNKNRLDDIDFDEIYYNLIEDGLNMLEDSNLECNATSNLFKYLKSYSSNFTSNQLNKLCDIVIKNPNLCCFANDFKEIVSERINELNSDYSEIISEIISVRINLLKDFDPNIVNSGNIINDLRQFEYDFTNEQLDKLCEVIINNSDIINFAHDFNHILKVNEDTYDRDYDEIHCQIINKRIQKIRVQISNEDLCNIFKDLNEYSMKITENQMKTICEIVNDKKLNYCSGDYALDFFIANEDKFNDNVNDSIYQIIIDMKIDKLDRVTFGYSNANSILISMKHYLDKFTKAQINDLCIVANTNSQVYNSYKCRETLEYILDKTEDMIDNELYNETIIKNNIEKND